MKKITFIIVLLLCGMSGIAQRFVSTETSLKNVVIEEFTGRNCHACPSGHKKANELMRQYPGRVFVINIHEALTPETYPNFKTDDGRTIYYALTGSGIPNGLVNRNTEHGVSPSMWANDVSTLTKQEAICNIGGLVVVNESKRSATITVETYYTHESNSDVNYLTIAMSQDSVWGSQNEGESNPEQYVDGNYCHMHTLRDIITSTWGDEISPTTQGSLITKTYEYIIPETIGYPNGVDVILSHLEFVAFVANEIDYDATRPVLNAYRLPILLGTQEAVFPHFEMVNISQESFCSNNMNFTIDMMNRGLDELISIKMLMKIDNGETFEYEWNGNIASYNVGKVEFDMEVPFGIHDIEFKIVEANGVAFNYSKTISATCEKSDVIMVENEDDEIVLELMQDKFGNETTWKIIDDNDSIIASGGPYEYYFGQAFATELHEIPIKLPVNQCLKFTLSDSMGNGICCNHGEGYYKIIDGHGVVVIDGNGEFGSEVSHIFSLDVGENVDEISHESIKIYPNPAKDYIKLTADDFLLSSVKIYNCIGILVEEIEFYSNEGKINVSDYESGIYFINIYDNDGNVTTEKIMIMH